MNGFGGLIRLAGYSYRSATIGSTLVARRAGKYPASKATAARKPDAPKNAGRSKTLSPTNREIMTRDTIAASTIPTASPTAAARMVSDNTSRRTLHAARAESHADSDFLCPLRNRKPYRSIDAYRRHQQPEDADNGSRDGTQTRGYESRLIGECAAGIPHHCLQVTMGGL